MIAALREPIICRTDADRKRAAKLSKDFHRKIAKLFKQDGYEIDDCSDLARVYRVPMSYNHKYGEPRLAEVLVWNPEARVDIAALPVTTPEVSAAQSDTPHDRKADHDLIRQNCAWYDYQAGDGAATASEPEWFAAGATTACCTGGRELFHNYSSHHPQYSHREADKKFDHLERDVRPPNCAVIAETYGGEAFCAACEWRGKIKSPVQLGNERGLILAQERLAAPAGGWHEENQGWHASCQFPQRNPVFVAARS